MIKVYLNDASFEYDIFSLVKAFYPEYDIKIHDDYQEMRLGMSNSDLPIFIAIDFDSQDGISLKLCGLDEKEIYQESKTIAGLDRPQVKNTLKRMLYDALSSYTNRRLQWGTLNGIRPTKIPLKLIEEGKSNEEILQYMQDTYYISQDKGLECIDIARTEHDLLSKLDYERGYSIYIGIPYCPSKCLYCSFTSYPIAMWQDSVEDYLAALEKELIFVRDELSHKKLDTIYIGGGTPTSINADQLDRLLTMVEDYLPIQDVLEFTLEAGRPDSITRDKLEVIKRHSVDRISINPQTMNQKTLDLIGRHHTVDDIISVFNQARELGFDNINMDIILGLPGETQADVEHTLREIAKLKPDNLTVHSLALKRAARLNEEYDTYSKMGMINSNELMDIASAAARDMGMEAYYLYRQKNMAGNQENIGFAMPGKAGLYNILIMEEKQSIVALGAGAACKCVADGGKTVTRSENVKDPKVYIARIDEMIDRKRELFKEI